MTFSDDFLEAHAATIEAEGDLYENDPDDTETSLGLTRKDDPTYEGWQRIDAVKATLTEPKPPIKDGEPDHDDADYKKAYKKWVADIVRLLMPYRAEMIILSREPYYKKYWAPLRADEIKNKTEQKNFFRIAVNMGTVTAMHNMQDTVNLPRASSVSDELIAKLNPSL